ncbi:MAG TPA: hypothetical protein VFW74_15795 [Acidimicrobiia bacterium]|nr:hypothetical protein [Acidimicrobiia bacterium]
MRTRHHAMAGVPDVAARFADMDHARTAIEALENSGVDGGDIILTGTRALEAESAPTKTGADSRAVTHVFARTLRAIVLWGVAGIAVGLAVGAIILWVSGSWNAPAWLWVFGILGAFLGGTVGGMVGAERSISDSDAWNLTFQDVGEGSVWVGVRVDDDDHAQQALRVMQRAEPLAVRVDVREDGTS